jgi:predicted nucleic acid-binding protein
MVCVPEIADYEVRRELLRAGRMKGIRRLDAYKANLHYLPITSEAMLKAAEYWAEARRHGRPGSHEHSFDADMILAAQAVTCTTRSVVVASTNEKHLRHFVSADRWEDIK